MTMNKRLPRKLKKKIPKGPYCYELKSKDIMKDLLTKGFYSTRICPFYANIKLKDKPEELKDDIDLEYPEESVGWCKCLRSEIDDQVKNCSYNDNYRYNG